MIGSVIQLIKQVTVAEKEANRCGEEEPLLWENGIRTGRRNTYLYDDIRGDWKTNYGLCGKALVCS